ncbi:MAG TPA: hypothetical protein VKA70_06125 [Blastocatellia bacterium]|nr:hypothetical protein [Blastocatellia bacterium]
MACGCGCAQKRIGSICPSAMVRVRVFRMARPPVVPVGELRGVIYRASRSPGEPPKNYVHFFKERLPILVTDRTGKRLYIVGGQYQVTRKGIEG